MANTLFEIAGKIGLEIGESVKKLEEVKGKAEDTSSAISGNKKSLSERMTSFGNGAKRVGGQLTSAGKTMTKGFTAPILGVGTALLAGANKMGNMADELLDLSAITGMSTDALQEWRHVADVAGVSQDAVADSARRMTQRMEGLSEQSDENSEMFEKLGISHDRWVNSMDQDERMHSVISSLADMDDEMERNILAQEFFGRGWTDLAPILDSTSGELDALRGDAHELNKVIGEESLNEANDFRIEMAALKDEFMVVGREILTNFMPILRDEILPLIRDHVVPFVTRLADGLGSLVEWFTNLSPGMQGVVAGFIALLAAIGPIMGVLGPLITLVGALATAKWALMIPILLKVAAFLAIIAVIVLVIVYWEQLLEFIMKFIEAVIKGLAYLVEMIWEWLAEKGKQAIEAFKEAWRQTLEFIGRIVEGIIEFFAEMVTKIREWVVDRVNEAIDRFKDAWEQTRQFASDLVSRLTQPFIDIYNTIKEFIQDKIGAIIDRFKQNFEDMRETITNVWDKITGVFERAIERIRGFFDFEFSWPRIPMPSFAINPSGWKMGDLLKGSIPKLDIQWNAAGGIFSQPTLFNTANAGMQGVGEAGPEAIIPLNNKTLGGIGAGIEANMSKDNSAIIAELRQIQNAIREEQKEFIIEMDKRQVGRAVRDEIDKGLANKTRTRRAAKGR